MLAPPEKERWHGICPTSYDRWFHAKVQEALDSKKPRIPHDAAMARVAASVARRRQERALSRDNYSQEAKNNPELINSISDCVDLLKD